MRRTLLLALLAACAPSAPAPVPLTQAPPAEAPKPAPPAPALAASAPSVSTPPREPPLTQQEIDLINADPATLTPEKRRERAFALRRKVMQNPDSPTARQLEEIRKAVESGELKPALPGKTPELVMHAPNASMSTPAPDVKAEAKAP